MTTPGGEKRCEGPFWSKMAFVWVARPTQALATCAQHQSAAVQTAGGPSTHAECSRANTCPDHTLGRFYQRTDRSNANIQPWLHSQVTDHTTEAALPCGCWLWRKLEAICYIYGVYKHISKMRNQCTVYLVKIWVAHIHCKPFKKKEHNWWPQTLVYFFIRNVQNECKRWKGLSDGPEQRRGVHSCKYRKTLTHTHTHTYISWGDRTLWHSCMVYMRKLFGSTTLTDWTRFSMYSGDHTDRRQAYFRMIFFLTVGQYFEEMG